MASRAVDLDPHVTASYNASHPFISPVVDDLIQSLPTGLEPMLATSWEFVDDGSYLELTLRQGVTFHDGEPFDGDAAKANIDRAMTVEGRSSLRNSPPSTRSRSSMITRSGFT